MFSMIPGVMLLSVVVPHPVVVQSTEPAAPTPTASASSSQITCAGFTRAVERYLGTRRRLLLEVPDLRVTKDSAEITKRSNALALAIQRARSTAQQGDLFDSACSRVITERLSRAFTGTEAAQLLKTINDEPTLKGPPRVHMRYPVASSMATMPTKLLDLLPPLPPELEYRLLGRSLVLRDRTAALLLDYVMQAIPSR